MSLPATAKDTFQRQHQQTPVTRDQWGNLSDCRIPASYLLGGASINNVQVNNSTTNTATAEGENAVAIGPEAEANHDGAIGVGYFSKPDADAAVSIGSRTRALGKDSVAVGGHVTSDKGAYVASGAIAGIAVGAQSVAGDVGAIAVGGSDTLYGAQALGSHSVAVGPLSLTSANGAIAIGSSSNGVTGTQATAQSAIAVGQDSAATATNALASGADSLASGNSAVSLGANTRATALNAVAIGGDPTTNEGAYAQEEGCIAVGTLAKAGGTSGTHAVSIGSNSRATHASSVAVGGSAIGNDGASALAARSIALGAGVQATAAAAIAIGSTDGSAAYVNSTAATYKFGRTASSSQSDWLTISSTGIESPLLQTNSVNAFHGFYARNPGTYGATVDETIPVGSIKPNIVFRVTSTCTLTLPESDATLWSTGALANCPDNYTFFMFVRTEAGATLTIEASAGGTFTLGALSYVIAPSSYAMFIVYKNNVNSSTLQRVV